MSPPPDSAADTGFSPRVVLGLVMAAVLAAGAFALLSAYAPELRNPQGEGPNALSPGATGYMGAVRLMRLMGQTIVVNRDPSALSRYEGLMVLTPNQPLKIDLPTKRDRLIVLPKWQTVPDPKRQAWERGMGLLPPQQVAAILPKIPGLTVSRRQGTEAASLQSTKIGPFPGPPRVIGAITQLQTISAPQLQPMVLDAHGGVVLARTGEATFVLSDPDLLNELGMKDPATARFTFELLKADTDEKPVSFDVTLNGIAQGRSLLRTAIEPPFLGATLCLLLAAALVGWQGWNRFGPPQPSQRAVALGKAALVDNGAGMIRMARREAAMARRYVRLSRERVAAALGAEHLDPPALEDFLDRWAERVGAKDRISALAAEAVTIKTSAAVAPLARRARLWQAEMTRATR